MVRLSDIIEKFIKDLLKGNNENELQIQRNELASHFSCAPSQINYVLTTRFTKDRGYYIESKRGGGGCIIIKRYIVNQNNSLMQLLNEKIGLSITCDGALKIIYGLNETKFISERESEIMRAAVNDRTLSTDFESRNRLRADILRSMVLIILS
jgi:transcriptional regulator of stress and heat shock response